MRDAKLSLIAISEHVKVGPYPLEIHYAVWLCFSLPRREAAHHAGRLPEETAPVTRTVFRQVFLLLCFFRSLCSLASGVTSWAGPSRQPNRAGCPGFPELTQVPLRVYPRRISEVLRFTDLDSEDQPSPCNPLYALIVAIVPRRVEY